MHKPKIDENSALFLWAFGQASACDCVKCKRKFHCMMLGFVTGFSGEVLYHVLWIDHAQAVYEYDEISERRSVLVPLGHPQVGSDWVTVALKFMCKNSCISGMNRRATEVIFTLEDSR